jgi:hypothetical protein
VKAPFALCPAHQDLNTAIPLYLVPPGRVAIVGRAEAVREVFSRLEMSLAGYIVVRPELPEDHGAQLLIVPVRIAGDVAEFGEFTSLGDGAFSCPAGMELTRSPAGDLCAYNPAIGRHSVIGPFPLAELN